MQPFRQPSSRHRKVLLADVPFGELDLGRTWIERGTWPASWISLPGLASPRTAAYRCRFSRDRQDRVRLHVTASERYQLLLDGEVVGEGPERGDPSEWAFDTYDLDLAAGAHCLVLLAWEMGEAAPRWQLNVGHGVLVAADDITLAQEFNTGTAQWDCLAIESVSFQRPFEHDYFSTGWNMILDGDTFPWGFENGAGDWGEVHIGPAGSSAGIRTRIPTSQGLLRPATVPDMSRSRYAPLTVRHADEHGSGAPVRQRDCLKPDLAAWQGAFDGGTVRVAANRRIRVLVDTEDYVVGRLSLRTSGGAGARVRTRWAEALVDDEDQKGHRDEIEGRYFAGVGDDFLIGGGRGHHYELPMLVRAGRYLMVEVETRQAELDIEEILVREVRYPMEIHGSYATDAPQFNELLTRCERTIDVSSQDVFTDGPYWEQMMWAGDGIQNTLMTYVRSHDDTLIRRWLTLLDQSRDASGLPCARWPARDRLLIGSYVFYWVQGLRDFMMWRDDMTFVRAMMPGVRAALDAVEHRVTAEGLLGPLPGWSFVDWVPAWEGGTPTGAETHPHTVMNWHWIMALSHAHEIESALGEHERAARYSRLARTASAQLSASRWDERRGVFVDTDESPTTSEHAQVFAVLAGQLNGTYRDRIREGIAGGDLDFTATPQFGHHTIEALRALGCDDQVWAMLQEWYPVLDRGFRTLPETPEPTRSDCHGWSGHPRFHVAATVAGVRPASPGFATVAIEPNLGPLSQVKVTVPHPRGEIRVELERQGNRIAGKVTLPKGVTGRFAIGGDHLALVPGSQTVTAMAQHGQRSKA